jgi:hypothetical protein
MPTKPRIKIGLLVGVAGLALNSCIAAAIGICGPIIALIAGAVAGFVAVRQEKPALKGAGAGYLSLPEQPKAADHAH